MTLTIAQQEAKYDAERSGAAWLKSDISCPCGISNPANARYCDQCGRAVGTLLLAVADLIDDTTVIATRPAEDNDALTPDEETVLDILLARQRSADEDTRMRQWREQQRTTGSPELRSLLDWIDARFDAGDSAAVDCLLTLLPADEQEDTNTMIAILEECDGGDCEPDPVPFGQLADGTPIMGTFDGVGSNYHRWEVVEVERAGWYITGDSRGCFGFGQNDGPLDIEEIHMPQIVALRDLLNSGAFERMVIAAEAWGRGDTEPPTFEQFKEEATHTAPLNS